MSKSTLREMFLAKRRSLSIEEYRSKNQSLCDKLRTDLKNRRPERIFAFTSFRGEADLLAVLKELAQDIPVGLPVIESARTMSFRRFEQESDLIENHLGILEPKKDLDKLEVVANTTVLTPGLAFGLDGSRLGYGGGFYDAFFSEHPKCLKVGIVFDGFVVSSLPSEPHDCRVDEIFTDSRHLIISSASNN